MSGQRSATRGGVVELGVPFARRRYVLIDRAAPSGWWGKLTATRTSSAGKWRDVDPDGRPAFDRLVLRSGEWVAVEGPGAAG